MSTRISALTRLRAAVFDVLPPSIQAKVYLARKGTVYRVEALEGVFFDLCIANNSPGWIDRVSTPLGHEVGVCRWLQSNLTAGDVFFDVGSAYGFFPALVSTLQPEVEIHAFEPGHLQRAFLVDNAGRSKGNQPWRMERRFVGKSTNNGVVRLDDYCSQNRTAPTIIKIDVDGAEIDVLTGAPELIEKKQTRFLIELHPHVLARFGASIQNVLAFFEGKYTLKVLTQIRERDSDEWSDDFSRIEEDFCPYILATPNL